jgi:transposase-like protein
MHKAKPDMQETNKNIQGNCIIMHEAEVVYSAPETETGIGLEIMEPLPAQFEGVTPANTRPEEEVFTVLTKVLESGGSITQTAREMNIPLSTLRAWLVKYKEEISTLNEMKKLEIAELLGCQVKDLVRAITKDKLEKASLRDIGVVAGIFTDKWKDLTGGTQGNNKISMRVAWKDGSGAVELTTGGQD